VRHPAPDDDLLFDWLAHYGALMVLVVVVVVSVAAATWATFAPPSAETWSIVADSAQNVPARQLGVVGEALFQTEDTYAEAMATLGMTGDPAQLYRLVSLRFVPESRLLIVAARTDDINTASAAASATAQALVHAFERTGYNGLQVLGPPQPAPITSELSVPALGLASTATAIILALAIAIISYRVRRPVLTLHRAAALLGPDAVASIPGRRHLLGALRRRPPAISRQAARLASSRLRGPGISLDTPGLPERDRRRLATSLGLPEGAHGYHLVVACDPRTRERDLRKTTAKTGSSVELLWIA
jgi:hypothetical protein